MLDAVSEETGQGSPPADPVSLATELLRVVPRLVDRTRSQAELASHLLGHLPCLGTLLGAPPADPEEERAAEGMHETVGIDVLSLLDEDLDAGRAAGDGAAPPTAAGPVAAAAVDTSSVPTEAELPIQDYDSLAASQVVPRLATMSRDDLLAVRDYELAHRNRQTILNRISQRLAE